MAPMELSFELKKRKKLEPTADRKLLTDREDPDRENGTPFSCCRWEPNRVVLSSATWYAPGMEIPENV
jgi:hypothetical protein